MKKNLQDLEEKQWNRIIIIMIGILVALVIGIVVVAIAIVKDSKEPFGTENKDTIESESTTETDSDMESETETDDTPTEQITETENTESRNPETESEIESETESLKDPNPDMYSTESGYTVYDPNNTRGLSTEKFGYGFGFASNEEPPQLSIDNQNRFDGYNSVDALALDMKTEGKVIYLTFDCGYEFENNTAEILDVLKEKNVKAAFFCTLDFLEDNPNTSARIINEGHVMGNHSATHPVFPDITRNQMARELYRVDEYLQNTYGYDCKYFRFPTGAYSEHSLELCTSVGYRSVFWSIAYDDWDTSNQGRVEYGFDKVTSRLHPGAVILLHAVSDDNVAFLGRFIDYARDKGYTFVTLDDYPW